MIKESIQSFCWLDLEQLSTYLNDFFHLLDPVHVLEHSLPWTLALFDKYLTSQRYRTDHWRPPTHHFSLSLSLALRFLFNLCLFSYHSSYVMNSSFFFSSSIFLCFFITLSLLSCFPTRPPPSLPVMSFSFSLNSLGAHWLIIRGTGMWVCVCVLQVYSRNVLTLNG